MSRSRIKRVSELKQDPITTPGSPYAVEHGCTCSPFTNNYGRGRPDREPRFVIATDCPMHSTPTQERTK